MQEPPFERLLLRVRPSRVAIVLASLPLVLAALLTCLGFASNRSFFIGIPHALMGFVAAAFFVHARRPWPSLAPERVRISGLGLTVGRERVRREALRAGFVYRDNEGRARVRMVRGRLQPDVEVIVSDVAEGRTLLEGLGLDALHSVATFRTASRLLARPQLVTISLLALGGLGFVFSHRGHLDLLPIVIGVVAVFVLGASWPARVDVGADGLVLRWAHQRRFIQATAIEGVTAYEEVFGKTVVTGVVLSLRDGSELKIPVTSSRWQSARTAMLLERIESILLPGAARPEGGAATAMLTRSRDDVSAGDWVKRLRRLGAGELATHRTAPIDTQALWQVVSDRSADPQLRAAAAVALGPTLGEAGRERLAQAAQATAEPRLRDALRVTADAKSDAVAADALDELAQDEGAGRARSG